MGNARVREKELSISVYSAIILAMGPFLIIHVLLNCLKLIFKPSVLNEAHYTM